MAEKKDMQSLMTLGKCVIGIILIYLFIYLFFGLHSKQLGELSLLAYICGSAPPCHSSKKTKKNSQIAQWNGATISRKIRAGRNGVCCESFAGSRAGRNKTTPLSAPSGGRQGTGEIPTMQPIKPKHASHANDVHHFRQRPLDPRINPRPPPCFLSTFSHPSTRSHLILQHFSNLDASVLWGRIWVPVR